MSNALRRGLGAAATGLALLLGAAEPVLACPSCAGRNDGPGTFIALGAMILLPFLIVGVVIPFLRRGPSGPRL